MNQYRLGFIGAGNMASAIVGGVLRKSLLPPQNIYMADPMADKLDHIHSLGVHLSTDNETTAKASDVLLLAIKPQMFDAVMPGLSDCVSGKCVVSIAPGITVAYLKKWLKGAHIVRVMPNTPLLVGLGSTAIAQADDIPEAEFELVKEIFSSAGEIAVLPESKMDAVVSVNSSSPAYFFRMADAIVTEAARQGIDPELALLLAAGTMEGSARMLLHSGKSPKELTAQVCSPGGTTLAALTAFDEMGFDSIISEAMARCTKRAIELRK